MAKRRSAPRSYMEPWIACKSLAHGKLPNVDGIPEDAAAGILDAWQRIDDNARWNIWGTGMAEPSVARGFLNGEPTVMDDRRIVIPVTRWMGLPEGAPDQEAVAKRIAACVNASRGIADPEQFVTDARALLLALAQGDTMDPRDDIRVFSLLARCIPPEELESFSHAQEL